MEEGYFTQLIFNESHLSVERGDKEEKLLLAAFFLLFSG